MTHTKGEWKAIRKEGTHIHRIYSNDVQEICETLMPYGLGENTRSEVTNQAEANAKLIAAAPELLEVCQSMIKAFMDAPDEWLMTADVMQAESIMKDAINKATI